MPKISIWSSNRRVYPTMFWKWGMCLWYLYLYSSLDWGRLWLQKRYRSRLFVSDFFSTLSDFRTWENFREFLNNLAKLQLFKSGKFDQNVNFSKLPNGFFVFVKFSFSEKATKICAILPMVFCGLLRKAEIYHNRVFKLAFTLPRPSEKSEKNVST